MLGFGLLATTLLANCEVAVNGLEYWPTTPQTWRTHTENYLTGGSGNATWAILPASTFGGYPVNEWTIRKDSIDSYWAPGHDANFRWFIVDQSYSYTPQPFWNQFIWGLGHQQLEPRPDGPGSEVIYHSASVYPPYALIGKTMLLPMFVQNDAGHLYTIGLPGTTAPNPAPASAPPALYYSWWMQARWRVRPAVPRRGPFPAQPEKQLLQMDYWEGPHVPNTAASGIQTIPVLIRETWYFERGVGLVELRAKIVDTGTAAPAYPTDADFANDEILHPDQLTVRVPY